MTPNNLDRSISPESYVKKCTECARDYRGEGYMDYCGECNAEMERTSPLRKRWACLNCNSTMECGEMKLGGRPGMGFVCPHCDSDNTHPAEGIQALDEYHGEIPPQPQRS